MTGNLRAWGLTLACALLCTAVVVLVAVLLHGYYWGLPQYVCYPPDPVCQAH